MDTPEFALALMKAYTDETGLPLTLSYERKRVLSEMSSRGITPEDVQRVLGELKRLVKTGTKGYSDASLDWRNAMANVDTLEERVLRLRQRALRGKRKEIETVVERNDGTGVIRSIHHQPEQREPKLISDLLGLKNQIRNS